MTINEFVDKYSDKPLNFSHEENLRIMRNAHIIDEDGFLDKRFFSEETIKKDREENRPFV